MELPYTISVIRFRCEVRMQSRDRVLELLVGLIALKTKDSHINEGATIKFGNGAIARWIGLWSQDQR